MNQNKLIYKSLNLKEKIKNYGYHIKNKEFNCAWCGNEHKRGFKVKKITSSNFTNWDLMQNPSSEYMCPACSAPFLGSKIKDIDYTNGNEKNLRRLLIYYHFIATKNKFIAFKNDELPEYLMNPPIPENEPFVFCVTYSYKKHNSFRAIINHSKDKFKIRAETKVINFDRKKAKDILPVLWELYLYFTKEEIINQHFPTNKIFQMGVDRFDELKKEQESLKYNFRELLVKILDSDKRQKQVKEMRNQRKEVKKQKKKIKKFIDKELKKWKEKSESDQLTLF